MAFTASSQQLAEALLWLRTANRVTVRVGVFTARTFGELERHAADIDWAAVLRPGGAVHFRLSSKKSRLYHDDARAERLERVVAAAVPDLAMVRPPSAAEAMESDVTTLPDVQRFVVRLHRDEVTISADASGALLHRRGWRQDVAQAPLLRRWPLRFAWDFVGWELGSRVRPIAIARSVVRIGTIAIEAALLHADGPAALVVSPPKLAAARRGPFLTARRTRLLMNSARR